MKIGFYQVEPRYDSSCLYLQIAHVDGQAEGSCLSVSEIEMLRCGQLAGMCIGLRTIVAELSEFS